MIRIRQDKNEVSKVPRSTEDLPDDLQEQYESMLDDFAHRVGDGSKVLDAGCGYGKDVEYLAGKHGLEVVGVDSDEEKIGWARENKEVGNY